MAKRLKTGSKNWVQSLRDALCRESPRLIECVKCGRVIREGYVCSFCGCDDPGENYVQPEDWL